MLWKDPSIEGFSLTGLTAWAECVDLCGQCHWVLVCILCSQKANMSDKKAVIKNADMSDEMQQDAVDCAMQAMEKYNIEKDIAAFVKKVHQIIKGVLMCNIFCMS